MHVRFRECDIAAGHDLPAQFPVSQGEVSFSRHVVARAARGAGPEAPRDAIRCRQRERAVLHAAAVAHKAAIVALSFSAAFPLRQAGDGLAALRRSLAPHVALWAGGEMTRRLRKSLPGVMLLPELAEALPALKTRRPEAA